MKLFYILIVVVATDFTSVCNPQSCSLKKRTLKIQSSSETEEKSLTFCHYKESLSVTYLEEAQMGTHVLSSLVIQFFIVSSEMPQICVVCMNSAFSSVLDSRLSLPLFANSEAFQSSLQAPSGPRREVIAFQRFSRQKVEFLQVNTAGTWTFVLMGSHILLAVLLF